MESNRVNKGFFQLIYYLFSIPFSIGTVILFFGKLIFSFGKFISKTIYLVFKTITQVITNSILFIFSVITRLFLAIKTCAFWFWKRYTSLWFNVISLIKVISKKFQLPASKPIPSVFFPLTMVGFFTGLITTITVIGWLYIQQLPYPHKLLDFGYPKPIRIYDRNNVLVYEAYVDPVTQLPTETSQFLQLVTVLSQDSTFYSHQGINWFDLAKSGGTVLFNKPIQPPRTISHQLARKTLGPPQTILELITEVLLVLKLESTYSKDQLVQLYLATTPIGKTIGINNAAKLYFDKTVAQLNQSEELYLLALLVESKADTLFVNPTKAEYNYRQLLSLLGQKKIVSEDQLVQLAALPQPQPQAIKIRAENATKLVLKEFSTLTSTETRYNGASIHTSLDIAYQNQLQRLILEQSLADHQTVPPIAVLVTDSSTGQVLAFTGTTLEDDVYENLIAIARAHQMKTSGYSTQPFHSILALKDAADTLLSKPVLSPSDSRITVLQTASNTGTTFTNSSVITVWVDPSISSKHPKILNVTMNTVANYVLAQQKTSADLSSI